MQQTVTGKKLPASYFNFTKSPSYIGNAMKSAKSAKSAKSGSKVGTAVKKLASTLKKKKVVKKPIKKKQSASQQFNAARKSYFGLKK